MNSNDMESSASKKRRMSQTLKLNVPEPQNQTLEELMKHGSYQNGNMVIDASGCKVIGNDLSQSMGQMSLESLGQNSAMNVEELCDKVLGKPEDAKIEKDSDGFGIPMSKNKKKQQTPQQELQQQQFNSQLHQNNNFNQFQMSQEEVQNLEKIGITDENQTQQDDQTILNVQSYQIPFNEITKIGVIGEGSAGVVRKALHEPSNTFIALKSIPLNTDEVFKKQLNIELNTLMKCNCDHIVKCYGACLHQGQIAIALEFMDMGTLADVQKQVGKIPEVILGIIIVQCLQGLQYLHDNLRIIHRDIKPQNLLVSSTGDIKIADFGVSGKLITNQQKNTWLGTVIYMAPERMKSEAYTADSDLWSLGITIVELAWGRYPYQGDGKGVYGFWELQEDIINKESPKLPEDFGPEMQDFIQVCLQKKSGQRQSAHDLLDHPLCQLYKEIDKSLFKEWLEPLQHK